MFSKLLKGLSFSGPKKYLPGSSIGLGAFIFSFDGV